MITPSDSPSAPEQYAAVPVQSADIQAPQADLTPTFDAANALSGAGVLYPRGPRQQQAEALLSSAQGFGEFDVTAGFTDGWPANVEPGG
jgi:hypothetical protein